LRFDHAELILIGAQGQGVTPQLWISRGMGRSRRKTGKGTSFTRAAETAEGGCRHTKALRTSCPLNWGGPRFLI